MKCDRKVGIAVKITNGNHDSERTITPKPQFYIDSNSCVRKLNL